MLLVMQATIVSILHGFVPENPVPETKTNSSTTHTVEHFNKMNWSFAIAQHWYYHLIREANSYHLLSDFDSFIINYHH